MSAQRRIAAFLDLAENDVEAAEVLAEKKNRYSAYHCQQAAEKLIKAVLLYHNLESGVEHHLDVLVDKLPDTSAWKAALRSLDKYTPYATAYRYPTPAGRIPMSPSASDITSDAVVIRALIARARRELAV